MSVFFWIKEWLGCKVTMKLQPCGCHDSIASCADLRPMLRVTVPNCDVSHDLISVEHEWETVHSTSCLLIQISLTLNSTTPKYCRDSIHSLPWTKIENNSDYMYHCFFRSSQAFSEWLHEDAFKRWRSAHEKGVGRHADAWEANADRWLGRCVY